MNIIKLLIERGSKIDEKGAEGETALHMAIGSGNHTNLKSIGYSIYSSFSEFFYIFSSDQMEIVKLLIANGADLNAKTEDNWSSLHVASAVGNLSFWFFTIDSS